MNRLKQYICGITSGHFEICTNIVVPGGIRVHVHDCNKCGHVGLAEVYPDYGEDNAWFTRPASVMGMSEQDQANYLN